MKNLRWRSTLVIFSILFSVYLLIPTVMKFGYNTQVPKVPKAGDPWYYNVLPSEVLKLGLDLRGGVHLVLGIDYAEVMRDEVVRLKSNLEQLAKDENIAGITVETAPNNQVNIKFGDEASWEQFDQKIGEFHGQNIDFVSQGSNSALLQLSTTRIDQVRERAREQALETIRNRIDEFGLAEPIIQPHGEEKILVQFPGVGQSEVGRIKAIIARTAKLSFQIVRTGPEVPDGLNKAPNTAQLTKMVEDFKSANKIEPTETKPIASYLTQINDSLIKAKKIPAETELVFSKQVDINTGLANYIPYLLDREHIVDGAELEDAYYGYDQQQGTPIVNFSLNANGARRFADGTGKNVRNYMAIVLDRNVHSAPRINERIPGGRAQITMGGNTGNPQDRVDDAKDTALVLRSGALPARLEFLEERTIGPSLGADAIRAGTTSLAIGTAIVLIFMLIYYRSSGMLAVMALLLNGLFVLGAMAAFQGTLTLPGIAGLTLTLGMAVDANVLIFEHIREELRSGKTVNMAIAEGYRRAFSAIFDSNLTTMVAALVLMSFGYGPIRGFAVTLLIGLVSSMFTAIFVTRVVIDYTVVSKGKTTLSI